MNIDRVWARILSVPYRRPDRWSSGENHGLTTVLTFVSTDDGLIGVGEANGDRSARAVAAAIGDMAPLLVGRTPFEIERIVADIFALGKWRNVRPFANQAIVGIETALWDLVGQACGQPISNLMGGRVRDRVDFFWYLQHQDTAAMVDDAVAARDAGYSVVYMKVGRDATEDLTNVRAVREAIGPGMKLRIDANEAWAPGVAVAMGARLEVFDIDFLEQPTPARDLVGLASVRQRTSIPIAANQAAFTHHDVLEVIRSNAADVIVTGPHQAGGLFQWKKIAAMVETAGLPINRHAVGELGIGAVAGLHVAATIPNLTDGNQSHHQLLADDILVEPLRFDDGTLSVPTMPGLGVELDHDKVDHYADAFERDGQYFNF